MARLALRHWLGSVLAAALFLLAVSPAIALPAWIPHKASQPQQTTAKSGSGLQEVAPPGGVQELRRSLDKHHPQLRLLSPKDGAVVKANPLTLELEISDWPLHQDDDLGFGPHVVVQIDDQPPQRLAESEDGLLRVTLAELNPGSHRFSAWAAYPWGEAVTTPGAAITWKLHRWQALAGTQPGQDAPWLVPIAPTSWRSGQPLLLNWLIWNAPLQNLRDGDQRWKLRLSLDGNSVLVDQQDAIWLKGPSHSDGVTVQMELLDGLGEPISPVFNNRVIHIGSRSGERAAWTKNHLRDQELAILSGTPPAKAPVQRPDPEPIADMTDQAEPAAESTERVVSSASESEGSEVAETLKTAAAETTTPDSDPVILDVKQVDAVPETSSEANNNVEANSNAEQDPKPTVGPETESRPDLQTSGLPVMSEQVEPTIDSRDDREPLLIPQSSLGGSARELLELN